MKTYVTFGQVDVHLVKALNFSSNPPHRKNFKMSRAFSQLFSKYFPKAY
jgi:hypothetical protein